MKICRIVNNDRSFYPNRDNMDDRRWGWVVPVGDIVVVLHEDTKRNFTEALIISGRCGIGFVVYPTHDRNTCLREIE